MSEPADGPMLSCPLPQPPGPLVLLAHGEGAGLTRRLIREVILPAFDNEYLRPLADAAVLPPIEGRLAVTTDHCVVTPLFFPGGDIGKLAVHAAMNDLAVCGAEPLYLTVGLIIEEGLPLETLRRAVASLAAAARACGVAVVAGDTKVVPRGAADGLFVNTTGVGRLRPDIDLGVHRIREGDQILVSGTLADHGMALLAAREGVELGDVLTSDTASVYPLVRALLGCGAEVHFLRDPTRGGLSAVLHEVVEATGLTAVIEEVSLPLAPPVRAACEVFGLDPLYVANEGKVVVLCPPTSTPRALKALRSDPLGRRASLIGSVHTAPRPQVLVRGALGQLRPLDEPSGAPLPRIC